MGDSKYKLRVNCPATYLIKCLKDIFYLLICFSEIDTLNSCTVLRDIRNTRTPDNPLNRFPVEYLQVDCGVGEKTILIWDRT